MQEIWATPHFHSFNQMLDSIKDGIKAVACKRSLDGVNWEELASTARRCKTFIRFVAGLHALVGTSAQAAGDERVDGLPSFLRRFM